MNEPEKPPPREDEEEELPEVDVMEPLKRDPEDVPPGLDPVVPPVPSE